MRPYGPPAPSAASDRFQLAEGWSTLRSEPKLMINEHDGGAGFQKHHCRLLEGSLDRFLNDSSSYRLKPGQVPLAENDCDITTVPGEMISSETLQMCVRRDEFIVRSLQYRRPVTLRTLRQSNCPRLSSFLRYRPS